MTQKDSMQTPDKHERSTESDTIQLKKKKTRLCFVALILAEQCGNRLRA